MADKIYHNYRMDFLGISVVTTDDRGIIVETALPFHKYKGKHIDEMVKELRDRSSFHGLKEIGKTKNGIVKNLGDDK